MPNLKQNNDCKQTKKFIFVPTTRSDMRHERNEFVFCFSIYNKIGSGKNFDIDRERESTELFSCNTSN